MFGAKRPSWIADLRYAGEAVAGHYVANHVDVRGSWQWEIVFDAGAATTWFLEGHGGV
ncbi:hypothetical protein [Rhodococcus opacus]|uniref:hypothetical protein n=1 Tax=Rhodococcus opacus TaxID=37919 RepID=UPI0022359773|nr:hypothetical protein [Rhodococcus opacus]UZG60230.1 hypothetical protein ONE62_41800 [Rhodococcus opacus]